MRRTLFPWPCLVLVGILAVAPPTPTSAQEASTVGITLPDAADDVAPIPEGPPLPYAGLSDGVDITEVRLEDTTMEFFRLVLRLKDLSAEADYPQPLSQGAEYFVCFTLGGQTYAAYLWLNNVVIPVVAGKWIGLVDGDCTGTGAVASQTLPNVSEYVDLDASEITFTVRRDIVAFLNGGTLPGVGDTVTQLKGVARDHRPAGAVRYDAVPNAGPGEGSYAFTLPAPNVDLKVRPEVNVPFSFPCGRNRDLPAYAIEAGGKRGVPVTVSNLRDAPTHTLFTVRTLEGSEWGPKIMPGIEVPAATGGAATNRTVNVIVDTPPSTQHKECSTITIAGTDAQDGRRVGEASFNVVAAVPPTPERNTFYLHADDQACNACASNHVWMNLQEDDADDDQKEVFMVRCEGSLPLSLDPAGIHFGLDVNPSRDIVLNTSATGKAAEAVLLFRSVGIPTSARLTATLLTLSEKGILPLGSAEVVADLGDSPTALTFAIPISFTREFVAEGDPSRVVDARSRLVLAIRYEPDPLDNNVPDARVAGQVFLVPDGSHLSLPIWATIKRNVNDPGVSGALVSLRVNSESDAFVNPGKTRVFNFTVLNEGAASDVAVISTRVTAAADVFSVAVVPAGPFTLDPGQSMAFQVGITPRSDAAESLSARVEVLAASQSDATASATASVTLVVTQAEQLGGDDFDAGVKPAGKGGLPGPGAAAVLAMAAGLGVLARRRRRA